MRKFKLITGILFTTLMVMASFNVALAVAPNENVNGNERLSLQLAIATLICLCLLIITIFLLLRERRKVENLKRFIKKESLGQKQLHNADSAGITHGGKENSSDDFSKIAEEPAQPPIDGVLESIDKIPELVPVDFGKNVIFCDDIEINRTLFMELFKDTNMVIDETESGDETIEFFEGSPDDYYDIIFLDAKMPGIDGFETLKRIRASERADAQSVPIIIMTTSENPEEAAMARELGASDLIMKPIDMNIATLMIKKYASGIDFAQTTEQIGEETEFDTGKTLAETTETKALDGVGTVATDDSGSKSYDIIRHATDANGFIAVDAFSDPTEEVEIKADDADETIAEATDGKTKSGLAVPYHMHYMSPTDYKTTARTDSELTQNFDEADPSDQSVNHGKTQTAVSEAMVSEQVDFLVAKAMREFENRADIQLLLEMAKKNKLAAESGDQASQNIDPITRDNQPVEGSQLAQNNQLVERSQLTQNSQSNSLTQTTQASLTTDNFYYGDEPKKKKSIIGRIFAWILLLAILSVLGFAGYRAAMDRLTPPETAEEPVVNVRTITAELADVNTNAIITGRLLAKAESSVMPKIPGQVTALYVEMGSRVRQGQTLFVLDSTQLNNTLNQATLALNDARTNLDRMIQLYYDGIIALQAYEQAQSTFDAAQQAYDASLSAFADYTVSAPISGYVTSVNIAVGSIASQAVAALTIANIDTLEIDANLSESLINKIHLGDTVDVLIKSFSNEAFKGNITAIAPAPVTGSLTYPIKISLDNPDDALKPGMFAEIVMASDIAEAVIAIPAKAVIIRSGRQVVITLDPNDQVVINDVVTGTDNGEVVEIREGISEGDRVVVEGQSYLDLSSRVNVIP